MKTLFTWHSSWFICRAKGTTPSQCKGVLLKHREETFDIKPGVNLQLVGAPSFRSFISFSFLIGRLGRAAAGWHAAKCKNRVDVLSSITSCLLHRWQLLTCGLVWWMSSVGKRRRWPTFQCSKRCFFMEGCFLGDQGSVHVCMCVRACLCAVILRGQTCAYFVHIEFSIQLSIPPQEIAPIRI